MLVNYVSLTAFRHSLDSGVLVSPDVLLRCHRAVFGKRCEDCFIAAGVKGLGGFELVLGILWDLVLYVGGHSVDIHTIVRDQA